MLHRNDIFEHNSLFISFLPRKKKLTDFVTIILVVALSIPTDTRTFSLSLSLSLSRFFVITSL